MGLFSIFGTSLRAMSAYSAAMGVMANNISNSNNENYSRQRVTFTNYSPDVFGGVEIGRGVLLDSVTQVVNDAIEVRLNEAHQDIGRYEAQSSSLSSVENILNEVGGDGLNQSVVEFFNAWSALSTEPESTIARQNVLLQAEKMTDYFHQYGETLHNLRETINTEISATLPLINSKIQEIAEMNQKIRESTAEEPLAFKDERRRLLNELGEMIDVVAIENGDDLMVYTEAGQPLVSGITTATLSVEVDVTNDNLYKINYQLGDSSILTNITADIAGGRLKGLLDARDSNITDYQDKLDDMAYTIMNEVNTLHSTGYDLDGNTGNNFFQDLGGVVDGAARFLQLDPLTVEGNPRGIAISAAPDEIPGGNDVGIAIAGLYESTTITFQDGSDNSFVGFYGNLISDVGSDKLSADNSVEFYESVMSQVKLERSVHSGVNVDEEQVEMIKLQAAYQAAGQMIKVADSILNSLFQALGFG